MIHSGQGPRYTSLKSIRPVESQELRRPMFHRENCWDNAPWESGHMKDELTGEMPGWTSFVEAKASVDRWMECYIRNRCQRDLAKLPPDEYYQCRIFNYYSDYCDSGKYYCTEKEIEGANTN